MKPTKVDFPSNFTIRPLERGLYRSILILTHKNSPHPTPSFSVSTSSTYPTEAPSLNPTSRPTHAKGRFVIRTQNDARSKVNSDGDVRPSKSSTKKRLPSKTYGRPSKILALSLTSSNSIKKRFLPKILKVNNFFSLHQRKNVSLIVSLLMILSDKSFPMMQSCPQLIIPFTSVFWISSSPSSSSAREIFATNWKAHPPSEK